MKFKNLHVWLIVLLVLSVGGLSVNTTSAQKPTLTIWTWHGIEDPDVVMPILEDFEEKYNINLQHEGYGFPDMPKKQLMAAEAGAMPDLTEIWSSNVVSTLAEKEALANLDNVPFLNRFFDWSFITYKGHHYSLPIFAYNLEVLYNTNMFKEKFDPPRNWEELESVCKKLTDKEKGIYGITIPGNDSETLLYLSYFIAQNGGRVGLPKEMGRVPKREVTVKDIGINKSAAVEALKFALHIAKEYGSPFVGTSYKTARELFIKGKAGMLWDGPHTIRFMAVYKPDFRIGAARMPIGPIGKPAAALAPGDTSIAMSSTTKHKDLCLKFIDYITSDEVMKKWSAAVTFTPANKAAAAYLKSVDIRSIPAMEQFAGTEPEWYIIAPYNYMPPQLEEALDIFNTEIQKAALEEKTVQEAMDTVAKKWKALWDEWQAAHR